MGRCCVPHCKSGKYVPAHKFPKNPIRCSEWINSLQLNHLKRYCANQLQAYKVCHKHFPEEYYSRTLHRRFLLSTAIPVLSVANSNVERVETVIKNLSEQRQLEEQNKIEEKHSQFSQNINVQNKHADPKAILEEDSSQLSQLEEMQISSNIQQTEKKKEYKNKLKKTMLQQNVVRDKILEQQEETDNVQLTKQYTEL